jgi:Flp pilus assembly protein TadD
VALGQGALPEARVQLRKALTLDDGDWQTWLDLALASRGASRSRALERASELYPSNPQIKRLQEQRGSSG